VRAEWLLSNPLEQAGKGLYKKKKRREEREGKTPYEKKIVSELARKDGGCPLETGSS